MRRRDFITLLASTVAAWPLPVHAQQADRVRRVGILMPYAKTDSENQARIQTFKQELAKLGWAGGRNVQFDEHWTTDNMDLVRTEAATLMASNPDVIVATGGRVIPVLMHCRTRSRLCSREEAIQSALVMLKLWRTRGATSRALRRLNSQCLPNHSRY